VQRHPTDVRLALFLARVQEETGDPGAADKTYQSLEARARTAKDTALLSALRFQHAQLQIRNGLFKEAEAYYAEAVKSPDASALNWWTYAPLAALTGHLPEALRALETTAALDLKTRGQRTDTGRQAVHAARYRAGVVALALGQRDRAETLFTQAQAALGERTRTGPAAEAAAFLAWLRRADAKSPLLAYQRSDERWANFPWPTLPALPDPEDDPGVPRLGNASATTLGWAAMLDAALKKYPDCYPAMYAIARPQLQLAHYAPAVESLRKAAAAKPDWWAPHWALGQCYLTYRIYPNAVRSFQSVVTAAPTFALAQTYLKRAENLEANPPPAPQPGTQ
jgi:tetratricopeptide (TPR) repeat protein